MKDEENLPASQQKQKENARFPRANEERVRPRGDQAQAGKRQEEPRRLIGPEGSEMGALAATSRNDCRQ